MLLVIFAKTIGRYSYFEYGAHALYTHSQLLPIKINATDFLPGASLHQRLWWPLCRLEYPDFSNLQGMGSL